MFIASPGFLSYWPQGYSISRVLGGRFSTLPGSLIHHTPVIGPLDSLYQTQNNFTNAEIQENDAFGSRNPMIYSYPSDNADREAAQYCSLTGMLAAGRDIVYVDGKPFIAEFARLPESAR